MDITYNFGVVTVDGFTFNETKLANVINTVLNKLQLVDEFTFTPCEIVFHNCIFKDTTMTLYDTDIITLENDAIVYYFNKTIKKFFGEYIINITIKFEYCEYFMCAWGFEMYPNYIPVYNKDHVKLANLGIFIDSNKIKYHEGTNIPSYPAGVRVGYKLLCESISSHIKRYYICRISIPNDATTVCPISGTIRSNKVHIDRIRTLVEINSYNYSDKVFNFIDMEDVRSVTHTPFAGSYDERIVYTVDNDIEVDVIETSSYKSHGPGIYFFRDVESAIEYLNRSVSKECNILEKENGRVEILSKYLLDIPDVYTIKS